VTYAAHLWPLTCLAPDIVTAIIEGRQPRGLTVNRMLLDVSESWKEQRRVWEFERAR
jgi:hypothetical protein